MVLRKSIVAFLCGFCLLLISSHTYAQKRHLELRNIETNKVRKIKENKKITVYTKNFKIKGPLKIADTKTILIKGKEIKIDDIIKIENKSILAKLLTALGLPIGSLMALGSFGVTHSAPDSELLTIGIIVTSVGLISLLTKKKFKNDAYALTIN